MKVAVLDLGTNTFHLLIAEVHPDKSFRKLFRSKVTVKLGEGAIHEKYIAPVPFRRGIRALKHYAGVLKRYKPQHVFAFATSGIRSARNGKDFVETAKRETGIDITVISGSREAELICYGVRECVTLDEKPVLIVDIGGGSTEFIIANRDTIFFMQSFDIGASRLLETFRPSDPIKPIEIKKIESYVWKTLLPVRKALKKFPAQTLVGSSGSFDTLAEMIGWKFYRRDVLKGVNSYRFSLDDYSKIHLAILSSTTRQRRRMKGLVKMRVDMIVLASICTDLVLKKFRMKEMVVSKFALKEGALWYLRNTGLRNTN